MQDNYLQMMIDSLIMKKSILEKITILNEEQRKLAESEFDEENFLKVDGFNSLFERVKKALEGNRDKYKSQIERIQQLIRDVTALSVRVEAQEKRNKSLIEKQFFVLKKDIYSAKDNANKMNSYYKNMNKMSFESQFMDRKQ